MKNLFILIVCFLMLTTGCTDTEHKNGNENVKYADTIDFQIIEESRNQVPIKVSPGILEQKLIDAGLVNVKDIDPTILVDLKYSSLDNFMGLDLYGDLEQCYLQQTSAEMLANAQKYLKEIRPKYTLLVYDGARPLHIQQKLWDTLDMPLTEKKSFVADPKIGSIHNYGSAVDLTVAHEDGTPLDMGTPYDYFGDLAYPSKEVEMFEKGLLDEHHLKNRKLLREVMIKAGFTPIKYEWWHFNAVSRARAKEIYDIIE